MFGTMPRGKTLTLRRRVIRHFAVLSRLDPRHHAALDVMVRSKKFKPQRVQDWCAALGCAVDKGALYRYREHILERDRETRRAKDAVGRDAEDVLSYARLARVPNPPDFTESSVALCELLMFNVLMNLRGEDIKLDLKILARYGDALTAVVNARQEWESRRRTRKQGRVRARKTLRRREEV
jgi:hypothetical protein